MKIAILGWGSLIWNQGELKVQNNKWYEDGPALPIEFARISRDKRLTLVIKQGAQKVTVLYSLSELSNLEEARENLRIREGASIDKIGFFDFVNSKNSENSKQVVLDAISEWNNTKKFDVVLWTDLSPNFKDNSKQDFNIENINKYLESLSIEDFKKAKEYIIKAPAQIQTGFRSYIEAKL